MIGLSRQGPSLAQPLEAQKEHKQQHKQKRTRTGTRMRMYSLFHLSREHRVRVLFFLEAGICGPRIRKLARWTGYGVKKPKKGDGERGRQIATSAMSMTQIERL